MQLLDGKGRGNLAHVDDDGKVLNKAITYPSEREAAINGDAYAVVIEADPQGTDQDFIYLKNLDDRDLIIYKIRMSTGTLDIDVDIKLNVTGSPTAGTAATPANARAGSENAANVTCEYKAGDLALTGGTVFDTLYIDKDFVGEQEFDYPAGIILPKNKALVFNCVAVDPTAAINSEIFFYFDRPKS